MEKVLIEMIFKGVLPTLNLNFLKNLLLDAKEIRFNDPEVSGKDCFEDVLDVFHSNDYVDFVVTTDKLDINGEIVPKVFINLGLDGEKMELLFYFNLQDLNKNSLAESLDYLKNWADNFKSYYEFDQFICQMDNANEDEYYFDDQGRGPLYG